MFVAINAYNRNLNERLARKEKKYLDRSQQLDLVIVVDRLLTGFDAPPRKEIQTTGNLGLIVPYKTPYLARILLTNTR